MRLIPIDCAVNDDHGNVTNRVQAIHVPGLSLESFDTAGVHFREISGAIRVSRRKWPARHLINCVGNIYWERYGMESWTAAAFLHYLRKTKAFDTNSGFDELWKWWESGIAADAHVRDLLVDYAKDDRL